MNKLNVSPRDFEVVLVLDCAGVGTDPSMALRPERLTGETASEVEVEAAPVATVMAWWPHNIRSIFFSSCCVRSSVARLAECPSMDALRSDISSLIL